MKATPPLIRMGLPQPGGALVATALRAGLPVLFSANAFSRSFHSGYRRGEFAGFNLRAARALPKALDAALDSAGFVAAARYGDYRWGVEDYLDLVATRRWTWWAQMDYCVEPEIVCSRLVRRMRIEATVDGWWRCLRAADQRALPPPMPVLQGWVANDYIECLEGMSLTDNEDVRLVGLGSVCRRHLHGPDGVATIVQALDRVLPKHVQLHLFGVKGNVLEAVVPTGRVASIDSMAWDYGVRATQRTGRTQAMRGEAMLSWHARATNASNYEGTRTRHKRERDPAGESWQGHDTIEPVSDSAIVEKAVSTWYAQNLLSEHGYREAAWLADQDLQIILQRLQHGGLKDLAGDSDGPTSAAYAALVQSPRHTLCPV